MAKLPETDRCEYGLSRTKGLQTTLIDTTARRWRGLGSPSRRSIDAPSTMRLGSDKFRRSISPLNQYHVVMEVPPEDRAGSADA